ncbi:NlpC/P60 family protein [Flexibacterium corallicola]|uniref:NlpC/P60 family protein n=1 Tax=Flexibacterium corallicola TaxID=3037259 RepID=UPI00286FAA8F|nr:NlpC/P60 family protein [Pseudovibrio sp. M1P-2-3]
MADTDTIIAHARNWIGTPYRHRASKKGVGCDCLGLVRGVWRELLGHEPAPLPPYAPEWAEVSTRDTLLEAAQRFLVRAQMNVPDAGCVVLFRWREGAPCKHVGIMSGQERFIHAYDRVGTVESPLVPMWRTKIAAHFQFPLIFQ